VNDVSHLLTASIIKAKSRDWGRTLLWNVG
jgi:hypothetical protein